MRHDETWKLETRTKTRHTSVETEPRPRREKQCVETVTRQDTCHCCHETVNLVTGRTSDSYKPVHYIPCLSISLSLVDLYKTFSSRQDQEGPKAVLDMSGLGETGVAGLVLLFCN